MRDILDLFIIKNRDLSSLYLQDNDWLVINSLIQLLELFFIATEILSTSMYSIINDIRLTIIVANLINFKLQEYWEYVDEPTTIGALLDPRSKAKTFKDMNKRDRAIALLQNKQSFFESLISEQASEQVTVEDEITRYFAILVDPNTNLLDWWHHFGKDFSILANMALCYLSIQGSSMLSKQAFSIAANTITKIRCNLKPDTAHAVMCLKS
ncbi:3130_t:CDS:2 [Racocetra persica]|uniref:3130_t:CDS:1 n=1 Tax=Racocetra persica TaxID=160502 RepID=A0ACA9LKN4_9GLOM|nr:3130_t:CDS:2 [Racocetra persica]